MIYLLTWIQDRRARSKFRREWREVELWVAERSRAHRFARRYW